MAQVAHKLQYPTEQDTILTHMEIVHQEVRKLLRKGVVHYEYDELVQIGVIGLIEASRRYEEQKCSSFGVYARIRIQGAIIDEIRKRDWVPRSVRKRAQNLREAAEILQTRLKRKPTRAELAVELDIPEKNLEKFCRLAQIHSLLSLENDGENSMHHHIHSECKDAQEHILEQEQHQHLHQAIAALAPQERRMIEMYYFEDKGLREIAMEFGVSESRVCQIHTQIKRRIAKKIVHMK